MAPKHPINHSSSEEEESENEKLIDEQPHQNDEESDEESGDEYQTEGEDDEGDKESKKEKSLAQTPTVASKSLKSNSDSESDPDSYGAGQSPTASDFTIKPILPKPLKAVNKQSAKRPAEDDAVSKETSKKKKTTNGDDDEAKKGSCVQRLWSEEDEVAILKGMMEYKAKKGADPYVDMGAFFEFIKKSIHVEATKSQFADKLRRLKKKYLSNVAKGKKGADPVFSKAHDHECFNLSKKIWGNDNGKGKRKASQSGKAKNSTSVATPKKEYANGGIKEEVIIGEAMDVEAKHSTIESVNDRKDVASGDVLSAYPYLSLSCKLFPGFDGDLFRRGLSLVGPKKLKELENKWRELEEMELQVHVERLGIMKEQSQMLLETLKASRMY